MPGGVEGAAGIDDSGCSIDFGPDPITRAEAFEIGWHLNGAIRHCQDGRDLARYLTAEWAEKISDMGRDLGVSTLDKALVIVKQRITNRLKQQDERNGQGNAKAERHG